MCRLVCFSTCLTGWVNSFWRHLGSVTVLMALVVNCVDVAVWVRVIDVTVFVYGFFWVSSVCSRYFFNKRHWFLWCPSFLHWWHVGLGLSALVFVGCWLTVFICSSSGASKSFSSNSISRCVTIWSSVLFSKWAWFNNFFRCGGILAYMISSMKASAAIPNASLISFWSLSRKLAFFDLLDWRRVSGICVSLWPSIGVSPTFFRKPLEFLPNSLWLDQYCFRNFVAHLPSWENGSSWLCHLQSTDYEFWGSFGKK